MHNLLVSKHAKTLLGLLSNTLLCTENSEGSSFTLFVCFPLTRQRASGPPAPPVARIPRTLNFVASSVDTTVRRTSGYSVGFVLLSSRRSQRVDSNFRGCKWLSKTMCDEV